MRYFLVVRYLNFLGLSSIHRTTPVLCIATQQGTLPVLRKPPQIIIQITINSYSQLPMSGRMLIPDATLKYQGTHPHHLTSHNGPCNPPSIIANTHEGIHQFPNSIIRRQRLMALPYHNKRKLILRFKQHKWRRSLLIKYNRRGNTSSRPSNTSNRLITQMRNTIDQLQTRFRHQPNRCRCLKRKLTISSDIMHPCQILVPGANWSKIMYAKLQRNKNRGSYLSVCRHPPPSTEV